MITGAGYTKKQDVKIIKHQEQANKDQGKPYGAIFLHVFAVLKFHLFSHQRSAGTKSLVKSEI